MAAPCAAEIAASVDVDEEDQNDDDEEEDDGSEHELVVVIVTLCIEKLFEVVVTVTVTVTGSVSGFTVLHFNSQRETNATVELTSFFSSLSLFIFFPN